MSSADYPVPDDFKLTSDVRCPHKHGGEPPMFVCWQHGWAYDNWYYKTKEAMSD